MSGLAPRQGLYSEHAVAAMTEDIALVIDGLYTAPIVWDIDPAEYEAIYPYIVHINEAINFIIIRANHIHGELIHIHPASAQSLRDWIHIIEGYRPIYSASIHYV